jgi:hypothetical protein
MPRRHLVESARRQEGAGRLIAHPHCILRLVPPSIGLYVIAAHKSGTYRSLRSLRSSSSSGAIGGHDRIPI